DMTRDRLLWPRTVGKYHASDASLDRCSAIAGSRCPCRHDAAGARSIDAVCRFAIGGADRRVPKKRIRCKPRGCRAAIRLALERCCTSGRRALLRRHLAAPAWEATARERRLPKVQKTPL